MALDQDILDAISRHVRGGFETAADIVRIVIETVDEGETVDRDEVDAVVAAAFRSRRRAQAGWPAVTDCDRLDAAFAALNASGVIALHYAGYTQSDGYDEVVAAFDALDDPRQAIGYCFYHGQDLERAVDDGGLRLAFGPIDPAREDDEGPRIGRMVVDALAAAGLESAWNGSFRQRIDIPRIDWKRRGDPR